MIFVVCVWLDAIVLIFYAFYAFYAYVRPSRICRSSNVK